MSELSLIPETLTTNSREIADMVESRHDSVKRTIERCAEGGSISKPPMGDGIKGPNAAFSRFLN